MPDTNDINANDQYESPEHNQYLKRLRDLSSTGLVRTAGTLAWFEDNLRSIAGGALGMDDLHNRLWYLNEGLPVTVHVKPDIPDHLVFDNTLICFYSENEPKDGVVTVHVRNIPEDILEMLKGQG